MEGYNQIFFNLFEEEINEYLEDEINERQAVAKMWENENNYNNCDQTSQSIYTLDELSSKLEDVVEWLKEQEDRCSTCGAKMEEEKYITVSEDRGECHGQPCRENVVVGYDCPHCGEREDF